MGERVECGVSSLPYDVALIPTDDLARKAIAISGSFRPPNTRFILQDGHIFPHVSLYMANLRDSDIDRTRELLASIVTHAAPLQLTATKYAQNRGYLDVEYVFTEALDELKMAVIEAISTLRNGLLERDVARLPELNGVALENIQKYGYKYIGELARPHMTLTRFVDEEPKYVNMLPEPKEFSGEFPKIGLFEMGDNGTCVRRVFEFELGGNG